MLNKKISKIAIFGPHDRMNYGDFLFPLVIDYCFSIIANVQIEIKKFSLVNADFTDIGAFESKNIRSLKREINNRNIDYVIISGGECLGANWHTLYSFINPHYKYVYDRIPFYKLRLLCEYLPKYILGGRTKYAFSLKKSDFKNNDLKIYYNAVGGAWKVGDDVLRDLKLATVLNVRDLNSINKLRRADIMSNLSPDSAVILSKLYPFKKLVRSILDDYIFFQISNYHLSNVYDELIQQLIILNQKSGLKIVLCPIGTALGHEDHVVLQKVHSRIPNITILIKDVTIPNIISLMAYSKLYIGTSLHGIITAMNYGIPYIGLDKSVEKQVNYIFTWSIESLKSSYLLELNDLSKTAMNLLSLSLSEEILNKNEENQRVYFDNFKKIYYDIML